MNIYSEMPPFDKIPGGIFLEDIKDFPIEVQKSSIRKTLLSNVSVIEDFLSLKQVSYLRNLMDSFSNKESVSKSGLIDGSKEIGSYRNTVFCEELSKILTRIFRRQDFPSLLILDDYFPCELNGKSYWNFSSISPMFRMMTYKYGGEHVPHYDAPYVYKFDNSYQTLFSFVLYLTDNKTGATRFIKDNQEKKKLSKRNLSDWDRFALNEEVIQEEFPKSGKLLIFPHRLCHDVSKFLPEDKEEVRQIIRGDLVFKSV